MSHLTTKLKDLPIGKNKKVIRLMKDGLGRKFVWLGSTTYSYLIDDGSNDKKAKGTKKCKVKRRLN